MKLPYEQTCPYCGSLNAESLEGLSDEDDKPAFQCEECGNYFRLDATGWAEGIED